VIFETFHCYRARFLQNLFSPQLNKQGQSYFGNSLDAGYFPACTREDHRPEAESTKTEGGGGRGNTRSRDYDVTRIGSK
jgi:hypothetical protein